MMYQIFTILFDWVRERDMNLLENLNKQQREAVLHTEGPLLILAGAGSGKTRVLTHRIAYIIREKGVYPGNVLAITFTNKAAREMKERVEKLLGDLSENIWVGTFHSICVRILRRDIEKIGFERSFVIFDTEDQLKLLKDCIKELNLNEKIFPPKMVLEIIGKAKDELIEPEAYSNMYSSDFRLGKISKVYSLYQKRLKQNNALDFDDIILFTIKLLMDNPPVLKYYQQKFKYIHVDEYQDTNTAQYHLVSLLAHASRNLCVVGDDDQSIYGWRGANIRNILDFEKEFKDCKVIRLEQNYRSSQTILNAANNVIKNNIGRKKKTLWTQNPQGHKIQYYHGNNEHEEAMFVANEIRKLVMHENKSYNNFAVLYRMNAQSRVLEEILMREGIPYRIYGGLRFYDRKEIKDIIAYLRVVLNPLDEIALKRIINVPRRGIGNATLDTAEQIARNRGLSIFSIISSSAEIDELRRASSKLQKFVDLINRFRALKDSMRISELIQDVIKQSGILPELEAEKTEEAKSRIENIKEFISVAMEFEAQSDDQTLEAFLANISLVTDLDEYEEEKESIAMMTFHSAKGLEFPVVFMVGMEEGVFPGYRSISDENELEEERRLCYVGMTRAMEKLYLVNTHSRTLFGNTSYNKESRFIDEIPPELIDNLSENAYVDDYYGRKANSYYSRGVEKTRTNSFAPAKGFGIRIENSIKKSVAEFDFKEGDRVIHKKFGVGTISSIEKEGDDYKLEIQFKNFGMKRLMAAYASLVKLV
jgi:DNA helicase-2/ATP-dependent DNA helicase PcrA